MFCLYLHGTLFGQYCNNCWQKRKRLMEIVCVLKNSLSLSKQGRQVSVVKQFWHRHHTVCGFSNRLSTTSAVWMRLERAKFHKVISRYQKLLIYTISKLIINWILLLFPSCFHFRIFNLLLHFYWYNVSESIWLLPGTNISLTLFNLSLFISY